MRVAAPPAAGSVQMLPCRSIASVRPSGESATDIDVPSVTVTLVVPAARSIVTGACSAPPTGIHNLAGAPTPTSSAAVTTMTVRVRVIVSSDRRSIRLEAEPRTQLRDPRGNHVGDVAEGRTRREGCGQRRVGVEDVVQIEVERHTTAAADPYLLAHPQAQEVLRRELLRSERLEPQRHGAELGDRRAAVGIHLPEQVRPLSVQAAPALEEAGERNVVREAIRARRDPRPVPGIVPGKELVVRAVHG